MKAFLCCFLVLTALFTGAGRMAAQGTTAFTYQGQLRDGGTNANGAYTMIFRLYDAGTNGNLVVATAITNNLNLFNGLFSVNLDFGGTAFNGAARWLDITVTNGAAAQTLWPRVQVMPSPYALFAAVAGTVTNGAIGNAQLSANAIASTNIQGGAITSTQLAFGAVANSNLAVNAVATTNIQNGAVTSAQLANGAVMNNNLAGNAVNATNIASGQVVKSINGLTDNVNLSLIGILTPGDNTALFTNGYNLQVSALVPNMQVFTTNGIFTVPTNVTRIKVELWGGGGGGRGNNSSWYGGGGGAGGYAFNVINVTPGTNYPVTVGIGGTNGVAGTFSSFSNLVSATGGGAGTNAASNANGGGGIGGTTTNSIVSFGISGATTNSIVPFAGTAGAAGYLYWGGNGASAFGPLGGSGGLGSVTGSSGAAVSGGNASGPGAGGGGASAGSNPQLTGGGTGGPGLVIIYY